MGSYFYGQKFHWGFGPKDLIENPTKITCSGSAARVNSVVFKYLNEQGLNCLNKFFDVTTQSCFHLRGNFQKLKYPFRKTHNGQFALPYIGPNFWKKAPGTPKRTNNIDTFKHNLKKYSLNEIRSPISFFNLVSFSTINILIFIHKF